MARSSRPPDRPADAIPDDFDLDVRFGEPKIPGKGFQIISALGCPRTDFCPGPGTGCACFGATEFDTAQGPTCQRMCGETRGATCLKHCIDTIKRPGCGIIFTRRVVATCVNTCLGTCGAGCNAPGTSTCICG